MDDNFDRGEVNGVRGGADRHEGAGELELQKSRPARVGRYDKEALRSP